MSIVRSTGCNLLPVVFNNVRENKVLVVGLCCSVCPVVIGVGYVVRCIELRCGWPCGCEAGVWCRLEYVMNVGCRLTMVVYALEWGSWGWGGLVGTLWWRSGVCVAGKWVHPPP
jgi:hypothetical protein